MRIPNILNCDMPQISIDGTSSRAKCLTTALNATALANTTRSLYCKSMEATYLDFALVVVESAMAGFSIGFGFSLLKLPALAPWQPAVLALLVSIGLAQLIKVCISIYRCAVGESLLSRAYGLENLALNANTKAAQLPSWKEPSSGIINSCWRILFNRANEVTNYGRDTLNGRKA